MILLKGILIILVLLYSYYRTGVLFKKIINYKDNGIITTVLYGLVTNFSIFEIINLPFVFFYNSSTNVLYVCFIIIEIVLIILSYFFKIKNNQYELITLIKEYKDNVQKFKFNKYIYYILAIVIILFQIISSTFMFKQDADDSFYVSWANEAKNLDNLYDNDPSLGTEDSKFDYVYFLNTYEIYNGFIARLFNINIATLMHTIFQILYIPLSYCAYYLLIKSLTKKDMSGFSLLILAILFLFSGVSAKFKGVFLLGRIYQGKSIFLHILIPLAFYKLINYKSIDFKNIIVLLNIYVASVAFTPMTITLLSLIYGIYLLIILIKKEYKIFYKMLLLLIPIAIIGGLFVLLTVNNTTTLDEKIDTENFSQIYEIVDFIGVGKPILILYMISILTILLKGDEQQKEIGLFIPIIMLLLVFNPILTKLYVKIVTSATYWRLFWLMPIEITITIATSIVFDLLRKTDEKYIYTTFLIFVIILSGKYMYSKERGFSKFETLEKIPQYIIDEADYISKNSSKKALIMTPPEPWESCMIRQYTSEVNLIYSRSLYETLNPIDKEFIEKYNKLYYDNNENIDAKILNDFIKYNIDWIILPKTKQVLISDNSKYYIELENNENFILKLKE